MVLQIDNVLSLNLDARPSPNRGEFAIDPEEASGNDDGTLVCTRVSRGRFVAFGRIPNVWKSRSCPLAHHARCLMAGVRVPPRRPEGLRASFSAHTSFSA